jgi:hypothetical protein
MTVTPMSYLPKTGYRKLQLDQTGERCASPRNLLPMPNRRPASSLQFDQQLP